jgi:transcriptional regulator with XRE-family HTH domain
LAILIPALPFCHRELRAVKPKSDRYPKELNTLGDHIRARRFDLGLFQSQVAELIGVHPLTITNWEGNTSQPPVQYIPAIIQLLGYDPLESSTSFPQRLSVRRRARGLTQKQMASELGVDPSTIQDWESGLREPSQKKLGLIATFLR